MIKVARIWTKDGYKDLTRKEWSDLDNSKLHREDGPAYEDADGLKEWWLKGKLHRKDGPAIECENGSKRWYLKGKPHREDGPAVKWSDGSDEWWLNGNMLPKEEVETWLKENNINLKTDEGKMAFKLRWS